VLRYNPDAGGQRVTGKELSREDKQDFLLQQLNHVVKVAARPETFALLVTVIKIGYDCERTITTECGFVHLTPYPLEKTPRKWQRKQIFVEGEIRSQARV